MADAVERYISAQQYLSRAALGYAEGVVS